MVDGASPPRGPASTRGSRKKAPQRVHQRRPHRCLSTSDTTPGRAPLPGWFWRRGGASGGGKRARFARELTPLGAGEPRSQALIDHRRRWLIRTRLPRVGRAAGVEMHTESRAEGGCCSSGESRGGPRDRRAGCGSGAGVCFGETR